MSDSRRKRIIILLPRGEAVRNVIYTETLPLLHQYADVTLLSVIADDRFVKLSRDYVDRVLPLGDVPERRAVRYLRELLHRAHFRWINSGAAQYSRELNRYRARSLTARLKVNGLEAAARLLAARPVLESLTRLENALSYRQRTTDEFNRLFKAVQPDLVYNASHIHGVNGGGLAVRVARAMGIPTAGFLFSWDNLTSRSRIFEPYDHFFVWHEPMRRQLLDQYHRLTPDQVTITGTPQFDFHFQSQFWLDRATLAAEIGFDPARPFVFYTTAVGPFFPEEVRTVRRLIADMAAFDITPRPQLVVRIYPKAPDPQMLALAQETIEDVFFPPMSWDLQWFTPSFEDQPLYSSLLRECAVGVNAASTVSLELMMHDKPVVNLGFDPPGAALPHVMRYSKHLEFEHYRPVVDSGGVMVARTPDELAGRVLDGLRHPARQSEARRRFIADTFGATLDGHSGARVARAVLRLAGVSNVAGKEDSG